MIERVATIEDPSDDPQLALEKKDKSALLREVPWRAFGGTPGDHRSRLLSREIGRGSRRILGIPENTVKTRMFYARKRLAELLKAAGIERGWP